MRICVVGLGYVGVPTALKFAEVGHDVYGYDVNPTIVRALSDGTYQSVEPGVTELYRELLDADRIRFGGHVTRADAFILAVPTPLDAFAEPDLSAVFAAATAVAPYVTERTLVVLESTVPPGTTRRIQDLVNSPDASFAHVPERVLPGNVLNEIVLNDRVVGGTSPHAAEAARDLYATFVRGEIYLTTAEIAEAAKLMENAYRDVNVALANEFTRIANVLGISAREAIRLANLHPRVHILNPGVGVGGHCVPVDPLFLVSSAPHSAALLRMARTINDSQPGYVVSLLADMMGGLRARRVAVLGVAYKPNVDDVRETPVRDLLVALVKEGVLVSVHDPLVPRFGDWESQPLEDALPDADAVLVATGHRQFSTLSDAIIGLTRQGTVVLDTAACLDVGRWRSMGHHVAVLGDGATLAPVPDGPTLRPNVRGS